MKGTGEIFSLSSNFYIKIMLYNFYSKIIFHKYLLCFELNDELRFILKTVTSNCLVK